MLNWMMDEARSHMQKKPIILSVTTENGIIIPPRNLGKWERQSIPLVVSPDYKEIFSVFLDYFKNEAKTLGDTHLKTESDVLEFLINHKN